LRDTLAVATPTKVGTLKTIFNYLGNFWFHWITDVHLIKTPLSAETNDRVYWTGEGVPKFSDSTIATAGGGTDYPTNSYSLKLPAPAAAPNFAAGTGDVCEISELSDRFYVTTFVRTMGGLTEESGPSPVTPILTLCPDQQGVLTLIDQPPSGPYNITHIRIYRSIAGALHRVATVAVGTASYTDTMTMVNAAEQPVLPSEDWLHIPDDAKNLILLPNGVAAAISGKQVILSEPYQFHAWPLGNRYSFPEAPVAHAAFGNSIVVFLPGEKPQLLSGSDPSGMGQDYFELDQTCESARSVVTLAGMVIFAAPDGLCAVGPGVAQNLTQPLLSRDDWRALKPSSILGVAHDGRYYGFYDTGTVQGCFVFAPSDELAPWQSLDLLATAAWSDPSTDSLFLVVGGEIVQFDAGADLLSYSWESRQYILPSKVNMACAKIEASDYDDITLEVLVDGSVKHVQSVVSADPFWLPDGYTANRYGLRLTGTSEIQSAALAETMAEMEQL
jgi:hypothetical protein